MLRSRSCPHDLRSERNAERSAPEEPDAAARRLRRSLLDLIQLKQLDGPPNVVAGLPPTCASSSPAACGRQRHEDHRSIAARTARQVRGREWSRQSRCGTREAPGNAEAEEVGHPARRGPRPAASPTRRAPTSRCRVIPQTSWPPQAASARPAPGSTASRAGGGRAPSKQASRAPLPEQVKEATPLRGLEPVPGPAVAHGRRVSARTPPGGQRSPAVLRSRSIVTSAFPHGPGTALGHGMNPTAAATLYRSWFADRHPE